MRVAAIAIGLAAGVVLAPLSLAAVFTLRNEDLAEGMIALAAPVLLVPLVFVAAVRPRGGGQLLVAAASVSAGAYLWWLVAGAGTSPEEVAAMLGLYVSICALGGAFWWSALRRVAHAFLSPRWGPGRAGYSVPYSLSPKSPSPGTMYLCSFR